MSILELRLDAFILNRLRNTGRKSLSGTVMQLIIGIVPPVGPAGPAILPTRSLDFEECCVSGAELDPCRLI